MRVAIYLLGTELVSLETGPEATRTATDDNDDLEEGGQACAARSRRTSRASAGSSLAASELGADAVLGFTRPWRHVETDPMDG